jgi:pimeloyl-ACP methyl ester carboxylesterase
VFYDDARVTPERVEEYLSPLARPGAARFFARLLDGGDVALPAAIERIRVPTLVIWGGEDRWVTPSDADRFLRAIPGARKVVFERCGHIPQEEKPAEIARLLREFLKS